MQTRIKDQQSYCTKGQETYALPWQISGQWAAMHGSCDASKKFRVLESAARSMAKRYTASCPDIQNTGNGTPTPGHTNKDKNSSADNDTVMIAVKTEPADNMDHHVKVPVIGEAISSTRPLDPPAMGQLTVAAHPQSGIGRAEVCINFM